MVIHSKADAASVSCSHLSLVLNWSLKMIHCDVKFVPMTEIGNARMMMDESIVLVAINRPTGVSGTASPYPTVISVTIHHQNASGMDLKLC